VSGIIFEHLILEGFGPFRDPVQVELYPGMNNLVAENESGKSSVVAGILAVLYGLPGVSDPSRRGTRRFRNWDDPRCFRGRLDLRAGGKSFSLERDFDTHRVELQEVSGGKQRAIVTGLHNPRARKPNHRYEKWLGEILGARHRAAYEGTLCLRQPLPEEGRITASVQQLLSGGDVATREVLERLAHDLKSITRRTGDRGVTSQDQIKDRRLEEVEGEISELCGQIAAGREVVDSLEQVKAQAVEVTAGLSEARGALRRKQATRANWAEWRRLRDRYRNCLRRQRRLGDVCEEASVLETKIAGIRQRLQDDFPDPDDLPADTRDRLEDLITLADRRRTLRDDLHETGEQLTDLKENIRCLEGDVNGHLPWHELSGEPKGRLEALRDRVARLVREWDSFFADCRRADGLREQLRRNFRPFVRATDEELEAAASYEQRLSGLKDAERALEMELDRAQRDREDLAAKERDWAKRFSDLRQLPAHAAELIGERLQLFHRRREISGQLAGRRRRLQAPMYLRALGAGFMAVPAAASVHILEAGDAPFMVLLFGLVAGFCGQFLVALTYPLVHGGVMKEVRQLGSELAQLDERAQEIDGALGLAGEETELVRLQERLRARDEERSRLDARRRQMTGKEDVTRLRRALECARHQREEFFRLMRPFCQKFADVEAAAARWSQLEEERERAAERAGKFSESNFQCRPEKISEVDLHDVGYPWREAADFVQFACGAGHCETPGELVERLRQMDDAFWQQMQDDARRYNRLMRRIDELRAREQTLREVMDRYAGDLDAVQASESERARGLKEILDEVGGDARAAREQFDACLELVRRAENLCDRLGSCLQEFGADDVDELEEMLVDAGNRSRVAFSEWADFISSNPGLPSPEEADDYERVSQKMSALHEDIAQLEGQVEDLEKKSRELARRQSALEGREPVNIAGAERRLLDLEEERDRLQLLADALSEAHYELRGAAGRFHRSVRDRLGERTGAHLARVTGNPDREIVLDEEFSIRLRSDGRERALEQLSRGTRDQLYLSVRLAIADQLTGDNGLPMILDDPFVTCDHRRLRSLREILLREADRRQIILFAHSERYTDWGRRVYLSSCV